MILEITPPSMSLQVLQRRSEQIRRGHQRDVRTRVEQSLLSTLVDCADDLFTPETEVRPFDVEW